MSLELKMPALTPTMEKGTLAKWLVREGDTVKAGDLIAEIETDKATMEFESADEGRVFSLVVPEGTDNVAVGTVIAVLASGSEDDAAPALAPSQSLPEEAIEAISGPTEPAPESTATAPVEAIAASARAETVPVTPERQARQAPADRIKVSPLARRIAQFKGIDLDGVAGTGPKGRIVRADLGIGSLLPQAAPAPVPQNASAMTIAPPPDGVPVKSVKLSNMRRTIAKRLTESKQTVPHFYLTSRCNLDALLRLRGELNASLATRGVKLSVNDMLIKAMAVALQQVPDANVQFGGDQLHRFGRVDIAMAVAIDGGLITPVIKDAANLSLSGIALASKDLATKAREGKLAPQEYQGGTASISNLGMFGIDEMFPVINPPQALILGVGAGIEQPWKVDGAIGLATIMAATASFDHRAIDGAVAAQFMAAFKELVEAPLLIVT